MEILSITSPEQWNDLVKALPGAHALQTWEWGRVKAEVGWKAHPLLWRDEIGEVCAAALCLQRTVSLGGFAMKPSVMYIPRGPMLDWADTALVRRVLDDLQGFAKTKGAIFLKIDPDLPLGFGLPGSPDEQANPAGVAVQTDLKHRGWRFSDEQIQFRNTVLVDLTAPEEDMLARMKSKTRYNVRLATRKGVTVHPGSVEDIDLLYRMYAHTSVRDNFLIREKSYYDLVWRSFFSAGLAEPLIAEVDGQPVGAVVIFKFGGTAWYIYGMSLDEHREKMFTYLLQWEAMLRAKAAGCTAYDLWGAPDVFSEDDPMWGVYRFKEGLGGQVVHTLGAWDYPVKPWFYKLYSQVLPRILNVMRWRGKEETKRGISA